VNQSAHLLLNTKKIRYKTSIRTGAQTKKSKNKTLKNPQNKKKKNIKQKQKNRKITEIKQI